MNALSTTDFGGLEAIEVAEGRLLELPQVPVPLREFFAPGVYCREVVMPKGALIIGHCHKTEHLNVVMCGRATVMMNGELQVIDATREPVTFKSTVMVRKVLFIHEEMRWMTIHPTEETDRNKLEEDLISKSETFQQYEREIALLREHLKGDQLCLSLQ